MTIEKLMKDDCTELRGRPTNQFYITCIHEKFYLASDRKVEKKKSKEVEL